MAPQCSSFRNAPARQRGRQCFGTPHRKAQSATLPTPHEPPWRSDSTSDKPTSSKGAEPPNPSPPCPLGPRPEAFARGGGRARKCCAERNPLGRLPPLWYHSPAAVLSPAHLSLPLRPMEIWNPHAHRACIAASPAPTWEPANVARRGRRATMSSSRHEGRLAISAPIALLPTRPTSVPGTRLMQLPTQLLRWKFGTTLIQRHLHFSAASTSTRSWFFPASC